METIKINRKEVHDKYNSRCAYCGCYITLKEMPNSVTSIGYCAFIDCNPELEIIRK